MMRFCDILPFFSSFRATIPVISSQFLKSKYPADMILRYVIEDIKYHPELVIKYYDQMGVKITEYGFRSDYSRIIVDKLKRFNINSQASTFELRVLLSKLKTATSEEDIREIKGQHYNGFYAAFKKYAEKHYEGFKHRMMKEYDSRGLSHNSRGSKNRLNQDTKRLAVKEFIAYATEQVSECISLYEINNQPMTKLTSLCNVEKLYYYIADNMAKKKNNKNKIDRALYIRRYLEHVKRYIDKDKLVLNNLSIGFDYQDKHVYSISHMIDFVERVTQRKVVLEEPAKITAKDQVSEPVKVTSEEPVVEEQPKRIVENLVIYEEIFLDVKNTTVVRDRLGDYIKVSEQQSKENEGLSELLRRKSEYFRHLDFNEVRQGVNRYNGYIGFVVGDRVALEHFMKSESKNIIADEEAIYILDIKDFDMVRTLGKLDIIEKIKSGEIDATRIYHSGNWEERVDRALKLKRD